MDEITIRELLGGQSDGQMSIAPQGGSIEGFSLKESAPDINGDWKDYRYEYSHTEVVTVKVTKWFYKPKEIADDPN